MFLQVEMKRRDGKRLIKKNLYNENNLEVFEELTLFISQAERIEYTDDYNRVALIFKDGRNQYYDRRYPLGDMEIYSHDSEEDIKEYQLRILCRSYEFLYEFVDYLKINGNLFFDRSKEEE